MPCCLMTGRDQIMIILHHHHLHPNRQVTEMGRLATNGIIQNLILILIIFKIITRVDRIGSKIGLLNLNSKANFNRIWMCHYSRCSRTIIISNLSLISISSSVRSLLRWPNKYLRMFSLKMQTYSNQFKDLISLTIYNWIVFKVYHNLNLINRRTQHYFQRRLLKEMENWF